MLTCSLGRFRVSASSSARSSTAGKNLNWRMFADVSGEFRFWKLKVATLNETSQGPAALTIFGGLPPSLLPISFHIGDISEMDP